MGPQALDAFGHTRTLDLPRLGLMGRSPYWGLAPVAKSLLGQPTAYCIWARTFCRGAPGCVLVVGFVGPPLSHPGCLLLVVRGMLPREHCLVPALLRGRAHGLALPCPGLGSLYMLYMLLG